MTWAKTGAEFPDDCANVGLSDAAYRTHHEAICWLFKIEQLDCRIPKRLLRRFTGSDDHHRAVSELVALGWWQDRQDHYEVTRHGDTIRSGIAAQQNKRDRDKKAQRRHRDRKSGADTGDDVSADADRQTSKHLDEGPRT